MCDEVNEVFGWDRILLIKAIASASTRPEPRSDGK
jgi:hypothetical protein